MMSEPKTGQHDAMRPAQPAQPVTEASKITSAFDQAGRPVHQAPETSPQPTPIYAPVGGTVPPNPSYAAFWAPPAAPPKRQFHVDRSDAVMALAVVVLGFLWFNWLWPRMTTNPASDGSVDIHTYQPSIAVTAFFVLAITCSLVYFHHQKVLVKGPAIVGAVVIMAAALPFTIYDNTPLHVFAGMALLVGYITWHAYVSGTAMAHPVGGLTGADAINQTIVVPLSNLGAWFASLRMLGREGKRGNQLLFAIIGLIIAVPVFAAVMALLMSSDANFGTWMSNLASALTRIDIWGFVWQFCLGLVVAIYAAALLYGNAKREGTSSINRQKLAGWAVGAHKVATIAIAAPMLILSLMYVLFFAATGSSLFVAFSNRGGGTFAYAEYARNGFFQLVAVAAINLVVLGLARLFIQRQGDAYPRAARALGAVLSGLTLLLVVTAMSKLAIYTYQFGLTRLRLYTMWFTGVLLVVFVLVLIWHIHRFAVGRPILIFCVAAFLALQWANTDGLIARYNVDRYISGQAQTIDVDYLSQLSAAAVPAVVDLSQHSPNQGVKAEAQAALATLADEQLRPDIPWTAWNWQVTRARDVISH